MTAALGVISFAPATFSLTVRAAVTEATVSLAAMVPVVTVKAVKFGSNSP